MLTFWSLLFWNSLGTALFGLAVFAATRVRWVQVRPRLGHALWLLVFIKLITPPVIHLPLLPMPAAVHVDADTWVQAPNTNLPSTVSALPISEIERDSESIRERPRDSAIRLMMDRSNLNPRSVRWAYGVCAFVVWGAGTCLLFVVVIRQMMHIRRLIRHLSRSPEEVYSLVARIADAYALKHTPEVFVIDGTISPMLCLVGLRPILVLPKRLLNRIGPEQLQYVIGHELAHYARRDHWSNAFSFIVTALFWWHPIAWLALHELRAMQELCCDAFVITAGPCNRRQYAEAVLAAVEFVREELSGLPQLASGIGRSTLILRRFELMSATNLTYRLSVYTRMIIFIVVATFPCIPARSERPPDKTAPRGKSEAGAADLKAGRLDQKPEGPTIRVGKAQRLQSASPGKRSYAFTVQVPRGRRFGVTIREVPPRRGYASGTFTLEKVSDGAARVDLAFEDRREETKPGDDPLLSQANEIGYSYHAKECYGAGGSSICGVPLNHLSASQKKVVFLDPESDMAKAEAGTCVLLIVPQDANPTTRSEVEAIRPRGEVTVWLPKDESKKPPKTDELLHAWSAKEGRIGTSFVKFRRFLRGSEDLLPVETKAIDDLLTSSTGPLDGATALSRVPQILTDKGKKVWADAWGDHVLRSVGVKMIETYTFQKKLSYCRYYDGEVDLHYDASNKQADVYRRNESRLARIGVNDLQIIPPSGDLLAALTKVEVRFPFPRQEIVRLEDSQVLIDAKTSTGFIYRFRRSQPNYERNSFQFDPTTYPGGIDVPRVLITCSSRDHVLQLADVVAIDEARFNEAFQPGDFNLPLPMGTHILDYRKSPDRPQSHIVKADIADAAAYLKTKFK